MAQLQFRSDDTIKWRHGFGDGSKGSSYAVPANQSCAGTSGTKTITVTDSTGFLNGDLVLIHQTRGTGAGNWQLNKLITGAGTATFTMESTLTHTYTRSGASQAQVIELNQYKDMTTGSFSIPAWDQSKGGIVAFFDKGTTTVDGTITGSGKGYYGKGGGAGLGNKGAQGEGDPGAGSNGSTSRNGSGAGGGSNEGSVDTPYYGGGGGNGGAGSNGNGSSPGQGGNAVGNAALTSVFFGGGGGGASCNGGNAHGDGGGMIFIFSKDLVITGSIANIGTGGTGSYSGGAGGSVLIKAETATLGSGLITGTGISGGGTGRIHLDYSKSYTGTTTPAIDVTLDTTIVPGGTATGNMFLVI